MNNELKIFENEQFGSIRTVEENGKVLFCGADVANALGYADTAQAIRKNCKEDGLSIRQVIDSMGREQQAKFITEGNLYRLITHSKLPEAEKFEKWVFDDVLPTIRRHGMYATDELINNPDIAIAAFTALKEEREKTRQLTETVAVQNQQIAELKPKASYYDVVLNCADLLSISKIAKDYGKSAKWLNTLLHELGVQFKQGDIWLLFIHFYVFHYVTFFLPPPRAGLFFFAAVGVSLFPAYHIIENIFGNDGNVLPLSLYSSAFFCFELFPSLIEEQ